MQLAIRCARDSIPPLRLAILLDVAANADSRPGDVRKRISKPWRTVKREMEALTMLGLLVCDEEVTLGSGSDDKKEKTVWRYDLTEGFDRKTLLAMPSGKTIDPDPTPNPKADPEGYKRWIKRQVESGKAPDPKTDPTGFKSWTEGLQ